MDAYGVLGSGAMADPCWLACALGVIWCVLCAWVAAVVLVVGLRACECLRPVKRDRERRTCLSVSCSVLSLAMSACVCVWIGVDTY
eukprot:COSAG06_NODE_34708_length_469_cov_1.773585_1_plen_85_part_10